MSRLSAVDPLLWYFLGVISIWACRICPLGSYCCQDVPSFGNSLSRCLVFCQSTPYCVFWMVASFVYWACRIFCWGYGVVKMLSFGNRLSRCLWAIDSSMASSGCYTCMYIVFNPLLLYFSSVVSPLLAAHPLLCGKLCIFVPYKWPQPAAPTSYLKNQEVTDEYTTNCKWVCWFLFIVTLAVRNYMHPPPPPEELIPTISQLQEEAESWNDKPHK